MDDSLALNENIKKATKIELRYEYDKKQKEQQVARLEEDYRRFAIWTFVVVALVFALLILTALYFIQKQRNKKLYLEAQNSILKYSMIEQELDEEVTKREYLWEELQKRTDDQQQLNEELETKNKELMTKMLKLTSANETISSIIKRLNHQKKSMTMTPKALKSTNTMIAELKQHLNNDIWERFELSFKEVYTGFYTNLLNDFPILTSNDLRLCSFIRLNMNTKEIASVLNVSPNTVEVGRTRLRKKLNISNTNISLAGFIAKY